VNKGRSFKVRTVAKDGKAEILKVKFLGTTILLLAIGGLVVPVCKPEIAKDVWLITGPIVSGGIIVLAGQHERKRKP